MTSWDALFELKYSSKIPRSGSLATRELEAIRIGLLGIPFPPISFLNSQGSRLLECHCRRSREWNKGCRVCWSIGIGNRRRQIVNNQNEWKPFIQSFIDFFLNTYVLPVLSSKCSLIELVPIGRRIERILNTTDLLLSGGWDSLLDLIESGENCPCEELLWKIFRFELDRIERGSGRIFYMGNSDSLQRITRYTEILKNQKSHYLLSPMSVATTATDAASELVDESRSIKLVAEQQLDDLIELWHRSYSENPTPHCRRRLPIDQLLTAQATPAESPRNFSVLAHRYASPAESPHSLSVRAGHHVDNKSVLHEKPWESSVIQYEAELPVLPIYHVHDLKLRLDAKADDLGTMTIDPNFSTEIDAFHKVVLLHDPSVVENLCCNAVDEFFEFKSEERLVDLIASLVGDSVEMWTPAEEPSRRSMNVHAKLEGLQFAQKIISAYNDIFRLLLSVEYGVHCLSKCWTLLKNWRHSLAIYQVWWSLKSHLSSLHQYMRISSIEHNRQIFFRQLEEETSSYDHQLALHNSFIERVQRDLFLMKPAGDPYRSAIVELCRLSVSFRFIIQRSFAFQRDEEDVLFELEPLVSDLKEATGFLRLNLKSTMWI